MPKCLLLVDVQEGFISDKTRSVLPKIADLIDSGLFDFIVATQFINAEGSPYRRFLNWHRLANSPEIDLWSTVAENANLVIKKNTYTSVCDELLDFLKNNDIHEVYIAGIDTDCCVLKTAVDLYEAGIRPYVLSCYSASNGGQKSHDAAILVLSRMIGDNSIVKNKITS